MIILFSWSFSMIVMLISSNENNSRIHCFPRGALSCPIPAPLLRPFGPAGPGGGPGGNPFELGKSKARRPWDGRW